MAGDTSALTLALVAGGFTTFGVLAKIAYDSIAAGHDRKAQRSVRFADERRVAYDDFLSATSENRAYNAALHQLLGRALAGETEMTEEEQDAFPKSPMPDLVRALERVRRLAHDYSLISSAEAIVQLFGDMASAQRADLEHPGPNDEVTWFLLQRFLDDRLSEFTYGYRADLGFGVPSGAPKQWPIVPRKRVFSLDESERILRSHLPKKQKGSEGGGKSQ